MYGHKKRNWNFEKEFCTQWAYNLGLQLDEERWTTAQSHIKMYNSYVGILAEIGIADYALTWFTSYQTNHTFQVTWNSSLSKPCSLKTSVPQGSVLGLLLFSLYTRSLGSAITLHGFYYCYADDTHLFLSFCHPPPTPTLWRTYQNLWQTSLLRQLRSTSNSTLKLNSSSSLGKTAFVNGEEPGHDPWRGTVLCPQHHCCGPILQICLLQHLQICLLQHLQDPVFPHKRCNTTPGPSAGHLPPGLPASAAKPLKYIQNAAA